MVWRPRGNTEKLEMGQEKGINGGDLRLWLTRDSSCQAKFNLIIQGSPESEQSLENHFYQDSKTVYETGSHVKLILSYISSWICEMKIIT